MFEITLDGPGKNALGSQMTGFLFAKLAEANGAPVLLSGAGDSFCAGLDLEELARLDDAGLEAHLRRLEQLVEALFLYPGPTVACVNGHAIAGGAVLALCCDRRVAPAKAPKMRIGLNEVAIGMRFPPVTMAMVRACISRRHLNEVVLGARLFDPVGAARVGLVDELAEDAGAVARERLASLAALPGASYAAAKRDLREDAIASARGGERFKAILPEWTSPQARERLAAALKK